MIVPTILVKQCIMHHWKCVVLHFLSFHVNETLLDSRNKEHISRQYFVKIKSLAAKKGNSFLNEQFNVIASNAHMHDFISFLKFSATASQLTNNHFFTL